MTTSNPRGSLLPPAPPTNVIAQTRIKALQAVLEAEPVEARKGVLQYEIAALTEHRLGDPAAAAKLYLAAYNLNAEFRPPLYALIRIFETVRSFTNLERVYRAAVSSAGDDREKASALASLGALLRDRLQKPDEGIETLEQALQLDPGLQTAALLLERHYREAGDQESVERVVGQRAEQWRDPGLRAELLEEVSASLEREGRVDEAVESLQRAAGLSRERWYALGRLERLARAHGRVEAAAQAIEGRAEMAGRHARGEAGEQDRAFSLQVFSSVQQARERSAALWREAARLRLARLNDKPGAVASYGKALELFPDDLLLRQEQMLACELGGELDLAAEQARFLLQGDLPAPQRALLHFSLADFARSRGDIEAARQLLVEAGQADPDSVAVAAALERLLIDSGQYEQLVGDLEQRASGSKDEARAHALWRAGQVAADRLGDPQRGLALLASAIELAADRGPLLREAFALALGLGDQERVQSLGRALRELELDPEERCAVLGELYHAALCRPAATEVPAALGDALDSEACRSWAPDAARVQGALRQDNRLLGRGHDQLAELAGDAEVREAHLCAAARALSLAGDEQGATERLERALESSPTNSYAASLLEEILLAKGESDRVVALLRDVAEAQQSASRSELSLLHAGAAAEAAGNIELAVRSYEDAADRDPNALGPLWMLRRLAERSEDETLLLTALEGLTLRERNTGPPSYATLELGQRYEVLGKTDLVTEPLLAATIDREAGTAAAVSLALLPGEPMDPQDKNAVLTQLVDSSSGRVATAFSCERAAALVLDDAVAARDAVSGLLDERPDDRWARCASIFLAADQLERAQAFVDLGKTTEDRAAAVDLMLHGLRAYSLERGSEAAEDVLMLALSIAQASSDSIEAAVAVTESLAGGDDAETRAEAFDRLLAHTTEAARPPIDGAFARALSAAGRYEEAARVAQKLVEANPDDVCAWEVLRVCWRALKSWTGVVRACDRLAEKCQGNFRVMLLEEVAEVLITHLGDDEQAEKRLREALQIDPASDVAFDLLHDLLVRRDDTRGLLELIGFRIDIEDDTEEMVDLLYEQARLLRSTGDRVGALDSLDSLLTFDKGHVGALGLAAEIHASLEQWNEAVAMLRALAEAAATPEHKRMAHIGAAEFLERKLDDHAAAYQELDRLVELDLADITVHAKMAGLALRIGNHQDAVGALALASSLSDGEQRAAYEQLAGQIYAEQLGDKEQAIAAFRGALLAYPADDKSCEALSALMVDPVERQEILQGFEQAVRAELGKNQLDPAPLRKLRRAAALMGERDLQFLVLDTLHSLGLATNEETADHARIKGDTERPVRGKLTAKGVSDLRAPGDAAGPVEAATTLGEVAIAVAHIEPATFGVNKANRLSAREGNPVREELAALLDFFGLELGDFYVGGDDPLRIAAIPAPGAVHCWVVGAQVGSPFTAAQRFAVGRQAMALRLGVSPLVLGRSEEEALQLFRATALVVQKSAPPSGEQADLSALVRQIDKAITRKARKSLQAVLPAIMQDEQALADYIAAVRLTCLRAGLFVGGELEGALQAVLGERFDTVAVSRSPAAFDLVAFWVSREISGLRHEMGLAL
jgi:tetratricopeptide (TPR) repeat protein